VVRAGIALNTGKWQGYGDITMNVLDSGSQSTTITPLLWAAKSHFHIYTPPSNPMMIVSGIYCYNPTVDVVGRVLVQQNNACYTLAAPTRCALKPTSCPA
jgi:hypothetical protein